MDAINSQKGPIKTTAGLKDLLLEFTINCLLEQPSDVVPYAENYFKVLREKVNKYEVEVNKEIEGEDILSADIDMPPDLPFDYRNCRNRVIYSEGYNPEKDDDDDTERVFYPKTDIQKEKLVMNCRKCLLLKNLDNDNLNCVIDAMFERKVSPGEVVIKEGDDGDNFYIIESGIYDAYKTEDGLEQLIFTYDNMGSFGELALLYNMPRAATVIAKTEGILWVLDRQTFRKIVLKGAYKQRKRYEELIDNVPLLQGLNNYERMNLADALVAMTFKKDEIIINQNDTADGMYFVEDGTVKIIQIHQNHKGNEVMTKLRTVKAGGYFGELALLTEHPRAASVIAETDVKLAFIDSQAFERLLGPCMDLMKRNAEEYNNGQLLLVLSSTSIQ